MTICERCKELEARISVLEAQLQSSRPLQHKDAPSYYKTIIELLKDANLKPADLSQINLPLLTDTNATNLYDFATELLGLTPLNRAVGFIIFLKHKDPEYAVRLSNEMYKRTSEKMIRDSLNKLFPHQMPSLFLNQAVIEEKSTIETKNDGTKSNESKKENQEVTNEILNEEETFEGSIEKMKSLLEELLEQAYSDDIDPRLYQRIRDCAITVGPTDTYELFVRRELWPHFPSNLESKFSRVAFLALHRLLQELLDIFPPEIQDILQQKLNLIQITE